MEKRRGRKRARLAALVVLSVVVLGAAGFAGYASAARWLLSGPRLRSWINTSPETTLLEWDEAVSRWPGVVRLRNLRIRGSDANVEWEIRLAEARADFSVAALLSRTFRVERVAGTGLSFRLRQKVDRKDPTRPPTSVLPPIEGFADPPLRRSESPAPASSGGRPWTVDIGSIAIDRFDEIWIDAYRFEGSARLGGRFLLRPGQRARVGPAAIDFGNGTLKVGDRPFVSSLEGRIRTTIATWDPRRVQGSAVWHHVDAEIDLHGPTPGLEFVNYYLRRDREPRFAGGRGDLAITGAIKDGIASGRVRLSASGAQARRPRVEVELSGDLRAELRVPRWDLETSAIDLTGSSLRVSGVAAAGATDTRGWWGKFTLAPARLRDGLVARVALECRDARPLLAALGVGLPGWTRGLLTLEGLTADADVALAAGHTRIHALEAWGGKFHILGEYARRSQDERGVFLLETNLLRVGVHAQDGHASVHLLAVRSWFEQESAAIAQTSREDSGAAGK
ncbi:MAG TPA: hypothetical protein VGO79_08725 [Thermoanaerobaculia bacterium]